VRVTFCYRHIAPYHHAQLNALALHGVTVSVISYNNFSGVAFGNELSTPQKYTPMLLSSQDCEWSELNRSLAESRPRVVLVPGWGHSYALAALNWSMRNKVPCIAISDSQERDYPRNPIVESIKAKLIRLFSAGFVAGQSSKAYLTKLGLPAERITIGCDVVDNDHFIRGSEQARQDNEAIRMALGLPNRYFLAVNRLIPEKNVTSIIEAYAKYCDEGAPGGFGLVIVGDGPLQNELKKIVVSLQIENTVIFKGSVSYTDMPVYYSLASAFILASQIDPWGLVVNEAMCAGLPVLVSESCGSSVDLVQHGKNGFCFKPLDVATLAKLMAEVATDRDKASNMGLCSRDIIALWTLDRYVVNINKAIEIALKSPLPRDSLFNKVLLKLVIRWLLHNENTI